MNFEDLLEQELDKLNEERYEWTSLFLHGSTRYLEEGTILNPRYDQYSKDWSITNFFHILEQFRPIDVRSHRESVFMSKTVEDVSLSGGGTEYIFLVEPTVNLNDVSRHDLNWGSIISGLIDEFGDDYVEHLEEIKEYSLNYWYGIPSPNENIWEYLTPSAKVLEVFDGENDPRLQRIEHYL